MRVTLTSNYRRCLVSLALAFFMESAGLSPLWALTLGPQVTVSATVVVGGASLQIAHTPVTQGSAVTKDFVLVGQAGTTLFPAQPTYQQTLTTLSDVEPKTARAVRVHLEYRVRQNIAAQSLGDDWISSSPIEGPDPEGFAFQIPSDVVTGSILDYRFVSEAIKYPSNDSTPLVSQTTHFPAPTASDPAPFFSVGVQANANQVMNAAGGQIVVPNGNQAVGSTTLDVPSGTFSGVTNITLNQLPADSPLVPPGLSHPIAVYQLSADAPAAGWMQLRVLYPDFTYALLTASNGRDGIVDGTQIPVSHTTLTMWDGFAWNPIGGTPDTATNTLMVRINSLNWIAVIDGAPLTPTQRAPTLKVITPGGGNNQTADFAFGDRSDDTAISIYDINGHLVRTLMSLSSGRWDGRDDNGKMVESGVYIYQYTVDGQRVSGVIAVAK